MKVTKATIKKLYVDAIMKYQYAEDETKIRKDVHTGGNAPGNWAPHALLEIYCENGIMNATDIQDFSAEAAEFGVDPADAVCYHADIWANMDEYVNLMLQAQGCNNKCYSEGVNGGVVAVYWDA